MKRIFVVTAFSLVSLLAACGGGGGGSSSSDTGELAVQITDAPPDYSIIAQAHVTVREIEIHSSATGNSGFTTLYSGPGIDIDLLALKNGVTSLLVRADLPPGSYHQLRLKIPDAYLELTNGNVYSTALGNLDLTSLNTSGLKIFIQPPIVVVSKLSRTVLLDFDISKSFHPIPANDALNADHYKLMPVIKATNLSDTGEIRGVVHIASGAGVDLATVYVMPPGETDPANSVASTGTMGDGSYAVIGLSPGTYDVLAVKDPLSGSTLGVDVSVANVTTADVLVQ